MNEFVAGSIPASHPGANIFGGNFLWEGSLIVYQVAAGSTPVAIAFTIRRIRLLARSAADQAHAKEIETPMRYFASREATKRRGRF